MNRIYHTWDQWECYPAGFYDTKPLDPALSDDVCRKMYAEFLRDIPVFEAAMTRVLAEWPNSVEHYLTNERMNRLAWLGQAAACIALRLPSVYKGGFNQLTDEEQRAADTAALGALNRWLVSRDEEPMPDVESAGSKTQMDLY